MPSRPPFFPQERYDTCALACLRMLLAFHGTETSEDELIDKAEMEEGGVDIQELSALAQRYGLRADIQELSLEDLADCIAQERFPIVFPMDAEFAIHAVVPVRISAHFVTFLDPRRGQRRVSVRKFEASRRYLSNVGLVCDPR